MTERTGAEWLATYAQPTIGDVLKAQEAEIARLRSEVSECRKERLALEAEVDRLNDALDEASYS